MGHPVVSLDNLSVFAKKEKQEKVAKKRVRYFYSLDLTDLFFGHSSSFLQTSAQYPLNTGNANA